MSFDIRVSKDIGERQINVVIKTESKLVAVTGPSGIGKTTFLNCLAGITRADSGHITIGGKRLFDGDAKIDVPPQERGCGYAFQDSRLFPHLNVKQNLLYGSARLAGDRAIAFEELVALLDIASLLDRKPVNLSGGEVRRIAIGRALLSDPRFLLLDEPLTSLDDERGEYILALLEKLRDEQELPIIYVSHDSAEVARLTEQIVTLD